MDEASARYTVISVDCHTGAPAPIYREYLDPQHRELYDAEVRSEPPPLNADLETFEQFYRGNSRHLAPAAPAAQGATARRASTESWSDVFRIAYEHGDGMWESANRLRALETDGVVAEVMYPASQMTAGVPFGPTSGGAPGSDDPELVAAGVLAYNRWLADLCREAPARHAGIAQTSPLRDVDRVTAEVEFAARHELRGGISMPALVDDGPDWYDTVCDPVWARCEEAGLPVNLHGGLVRDRVHARAHDGIFRVADEATVARRPLWYFVAGGVLDRFPNLKLVFTEQLAAWVPEDVAALQQALDTCEQPPPELTARDYWARNCYVGATFFSRAEAGMRADIGIDRIMFGTDFPHPEGTYPFTREALRHTFEGVAPVELRAILGETAARVYGFDLSVLAPLAAQFGPSVAELAEPLTERPSRSLSLQWR